MENVDNAGLRYDTGKERWDLVPPDAMKEVVKVFTEGAKKYEDRNWEKGMKWSKCLAPLKRHLNKWEMGAMMDEEYPDLHHMAMVAWNAIALLTYELRDIGEDDVTGLNIKNSTSIINHQIFDEMYGLWKRDEISDEVFFRFMKWYREYYDEIK